MVRGPTRPALQPLAGQAPEVEGLCLYPRGLEVPQPGIDELLGTLAHELRSPLATILSAVQVITYTGDIAPPPRRAPPAVGPQPRQARGTTENLSRPAPWP